MNRKLKKECESTCEYILPDYMGDIRKVLVSRAKVLPTGRFFTDGTLEVAGMVEYEILYADSENKLTAVNASSDYEIKCALDSERYIDSVDESAVTGLSVRITGPRKMVMKANIKSEISVSENSHISVAGDVFDGAHEPECTVSKIDILESLNKGGQEREYAEEAERLPGVASDDIEILTTSGSVRILEAVSVDGGVRIKGELIVLALVRTPDQPVIAIRRVIPFEETVEIEGVTADMPATADGYITSASCGVNSDGEDSVIVVNVICEYNASAFGNSSLEVVTDAYLKDFEVDSKYSTLEYEALEAGGVYDIQINKSVSRESLGLLDASEIIFFSAEPRNVFCENAEGRMKICGEIAISGVACENNVDGSKGYIPVKTQVPFEEYVNFNCQISADAVIDLSLSCVDAEGMLDAENMYMKVTLKAKATALKNDKIMRLEECVCGDKVEKKASLSRITVYYPDKDDTLFNVAKRFHTTVEKLALDNSLAESAVATMESGDSLFGVERLIVR